MEQLRLRAERFRKQGRLRDEDLEEIIADIKASDKSTEKEADKMARCTSDDENKRVMEAVEEGLLQVHGRCDASQCGAKSNVSNPSLGLKKFILSHTCLHLSRTRLHRMSEDDQMRRHKKHKQQTNTITMMVEPLAPPAAWI